MRGGVEPAGNNTPRDGPPLLHGGAPEGLVEDSGDAGAMQAPSAGSVADDAGVVTASGSPTVRIGVAGEEEETEAKPPRFRKLGAALAWERGISRSDDGPLSRGGQGAPEHGPGARSREPGGSGRPAVEGSGELREANVCEEDTGAGCR